jgi:hypothetical protein
MTDERLIEEIKGIQYIVINTVHGGFGLSDRAERLFKEHTGLANSYLLLDSEISRDDPVVVDIVRELGEKANGRFANLKIVEVPYGVDWQIEEYDGLEWVAEKHRTWR